MIIIIIRRKYWCITSTALQIICLWNRAHYSGLYWNSLIRLLFKSRVRAYKTWVHTQLRLCSNFKVSIIVMTFRKIKFKTLIWLVETLKISTGQKLLQKVYQIWFNQLWNFMLSWVEHEKFYKHRAWLSNSSIMTIIIIIIIIIKPAAGAKSKGWNSRIRMISPSVYKNFLCLIQQDFLNFLQAQPNGLAQLKTMLLSN